jgi:hypothetical protein
MDEMDGTTPKVVPSISSSIQLYGDDIILLYRLSVITLSPLIPALIVN